MSANYFTPLQHAVLLAISEGKSLQAAADAAGVHRNTILNWRRANFDFRDAWDSIHYEQAMHWREQCVPLAPIAVDAIRDLLENPYTNPSLRLRAALAVHKIVSTPPPAGPEGRRKVVVDWNALLRMPEIAVNQHLAAPEDPEFDAENDAQVCTIAPKVAAPVGPAEAPGAPAATAKSMHNHAQSPTPAPVSAAAGTKPQPAEKKKSTHNAAQSEQPTYSPRFAERIAKVEKGAAEFGEYIRQKRARQDAEAQNKAVEARAKAAAAPQKQALKPAA